MVARYLVGCMLLLAVTIPRSFSQEPVEEEAFENMSAATEENAEEGDFPRLESLKENPLNLNTANDEELQELPFLTAVQIQAFMYYRRLLGDLISIYELQAIPGWDLLTIKRVLPYVSIARNMRLKEEVFERLKAGIHTTIVRLSRTFEQASGFKPDENNEKQFTGSAIKTLLRHRYNYANLQYGLQLEKDAGEKLFGKQYLPGDFLSFYICLLRLGIFNKLIIGDFAVNMGQGLILWQGPGFGKTSEALAIKKQAAFMRPYQSGGEVNFLRGIGLQSTVSRFNIAAFLSYRKLDANVEEDSLRSLITTGLHRTKDELDKKDRIKFLMAGASIQWKMNKINLSWNTIYERFSAPLSADIEPYKLYALKGRSFLYNSIGYDLTHRNLHAFGEVAVCSFNSFAIINGAMISLGKKIDLSVLLRVLQPSYQAWNNKIFGESSTSSNENGIYVGITLRPATQWKIDAYVDLFSFPWLKFRLDAPSWGKENLLNIQYRPSKKAEAFCRLKWERKQTHGSSDYLRTNTIVDQDKFSLRYQVKLDVSPHFSLRKRLEVVCLNTENQSQTGFLCFADASYRAKTLKMKTAARLQYFTASNYSARIYAFENDVSPGIAIPSFYITGWRYYLLVSFKPLETFSRKLSRKMNVDLAMRLSQTLYSDQSVIGSGVDEIRGNSKTEFHVQLRLSS